MLLAPRIAPISNGEIREQNVGSFAEYCSRVSGNAFISPKVDKPSTFSSYLFINTLTDSWEWYSASKLQALKVINFLA